MRKPAKLIVIAGSTLALLAGGGAAYAAVAANPPVTNPGAGSQGPYFTGTVSICVSQSNEGRAYVEENNAVLGNCAPGYTQLTVTATTPAG